MRSPGEGRVQEQQDRGQGLAVFFILQLFHVVVARGKVLGTVPASNADGSELVGTRLCTQATQVPMDGVQRRASCSGGTRAVTKRRPCQ